ncbi:hypothetical protein [Hahella ganghwensis]|uniref:hypothetical protein n=1 Tax=Hahella ganghwensis TaxID=286420 RepID=UPI00036F5BD2|nr:hypothetical protein [Hahella ganghwensis]
MRNRDIFLRHSFYTTASPEDFWIEVVHSEVYRSSKSKSNPKYLQKDGLRPADFDKAADPFAEDKLLIPNPNKGLSFADSMETLRNKKIRGKYLFRGQTAWMITPGPLPEGLVINYQDKSHPMINACRVMLESEFINKINTLLEQNRYICTNIKV